MIENFISRLEISKQPYQADLLPRTPRERANDEIEIFPGKSCPTVRLNHRDHLHSNIYAVWRLEYFRNFFTPSKPLLKRLVGVKFSQVQRLVRTSG
jgi:hypothetical protein